MYPFKLQFLARWCSVVFGTEAAVCRSLIDCLFCRDSHGQQVGYYRAGVDHLSRKRGELWRFPVCNCPKECLLINPCIDETNETGPLARTITLNLSVCKQRFILHMWLVKKLTTASLTLSPTPPHPNPLAPVVWFVFGMCMRSQSMEMMGCHGNNLKQLSPFRRLALDVWHLKSHASS